MASTDQHTIPTSSWPQRQDAPQPGPVDAAPSIPRLYMSADLRAATGLSRTHLDYYLREGVIRPFARTESGYLLFNDDEVELARRVIAWRADGISVRDILARLGRTP